MMKLGGFGFIKDYDAIKQAGFDYAELDMPEIEALSDGDFDAFRAHVQEMGFPIPTGARILPITEPTFFVPGFRETDLRPYLESSCARSAKVGIQKILFGNGKARWLIDDDSIKHEQVFVSFMRMLCEIAGKHGLSCRITLWSLLAVVLSLPYAFLDKLFLTRLFGPDAAGKGVRGPAGQYR